MNEKLFNQGRHPAGVFIKLKRLIADRSGVGAVEFALIAPLLLALYITSFELTIGFSVSSRVTRSASTIADLITREQNVDKDKLGTMKDVANSLFAPYTANNLKIKITGITVDGSGNPTVLWSWNETNGKPYTVGSMVDVPKDMRTPNSFLIRSEIAVDHTLLMFMPNLLPSQVNNISIAREYFYKQRLGNNVPCTNC